MSNYVQMFAGNLALALPPRATGTYMCLPCDVEFEYSPWQTNCPGCATDMRDDISALYIEHDVEEDEFVQMFDFGEGD